VSPAGPRIARPIVSPAEVSGYLVGSAAFKAVGASDPRTAGSIPVHLRQHLHRRSLTCIEGPLSRGFAKSSVRASVDVRGAFLSRLLSNRARE